jgi:hypothetical protein
VQGCEVRRGREILCQHLGHGPGVARDEPDEQRHETARAVRATRNIIRSGPGTDPGRQGFPGKIVTFELRL